MIPLYSQQEYKLAKAADKLPCQCTTCGQTFYKMKRDIKKVLKNIDGFTGDYCSNICHGAYRINRETVNCALCGKKVMKPLNQIKKTKHNFCSRSCSVTYHNTHKQSGAKRSKLEKWLESELQVLFANLEFHFNRKDAINSELDIYIPSLQLAFELNGIFHYEPIYGKDKLAQIKNNDTRKYQACIERRIELCIIDTSTFKHFKEHRAKKYLDIIANVINERLLIT